MKSKILIKNLKEEIVHKQKLVENLICLQKQFPDIEYIYCDNTYKRYVFMSDFVNQNQYTKIDFDFDEHLSLIFCYENKDCDILIESKVVLLMELTVDFTKNKSIKKLSFTKELKQILKSKNTDLIKLVKEAVINNIIDNQNDKSFDKVIFLKKNRPDFVNKMLAFM